MYKVYEDSQFTGRETDIVNYLIRTFVSFHPNQTNLRPLFNEYRTFKFRWSIYHEIPFDPIYRDVMYINNIKPTVLGGSTPYRYNDPKYYILIHLHEIIAAAVISNKYRGLSYLKYWWKLITGQLADEYVQLACALKVDTIRFVEAYEAYCEASELVSYNQVIAHDKNSLKYDIIYPVIIEIAQRM